MKKKCFVAKGSFNILFKLKKKRSSLLGINTEFVSTAAGESGKRNIESV